MSEQISGKQAKEAAQRLINSHFGNADPARMSIPAQPTDDDLTIMAYIEQAEARRASPTPGGRGLRAPCSEDQGRSTNVPPPA
jgi:hypothetical protein